MLIKTNRPQLYKFITKHSLKCLSNNLIQRWEMWHHVGNKLARETKQWLHTWRQILQTQDFTTTKLQTFTRPKSKSKAKVEIIDNKDPKICTLINSPKFKFKLQPRKFSQITPRQWVQDKADSVVIYKISLLRFHRNQFMHPSRISKKTNRSQIRHLILTPQTTGQ